jgi:hypothetical protein
MNSLSIFNRHQRQQHEAWPYTYDGAQPPAVHDRQMCTHSAFEKIACYCSCGWSAVASYNDRPLTDAENACVSAHKIHVSLA